MTEIRIPVPRLPSGLLANLFGLVGLVAVVVAVGGLTGNWWWSLLLGGVFAVGLSYVASTHVDAEASAEPVRPRPVAVAKSA